MAAFVFAKRERRREKRRNVFASSSVAALRAVYESGNLNSARSRKPPGPFKAGRECEAEWQKQLRVHLEQVNYARGGWGGVSRSTLTHNVAPFNSERPPPPPPPPFAAILMCLHYSRAPCKWTFSTFSSSTLGRRHRSRVCSATGKGFLQLCHSAGAPASPRSLYLQER